MRHDQRVNMGMSGMTYALTIGPAADKMFLSKLDGDIEFTEDELEALRFTNSADAEQALYAVEQMIMAPVFVALLP